MVWKSLIPHKVTSLECCYFITHMHNFVMGATPMLIIGKSIRKKNGAELLDGVSLSYRESTVSICCMLGNCHLPTSFIFFSNSFRNATTASNNSDTDHHRR